MIAAAAAVVETAGSAVVANGCQNNQNCVQTKLEISEKRPIKLNKQTHKISHILNNRNNALQYAREKNAPTLPKSGRRPLSRTPRPQPCPETS